MEAAPGEPPPAAVPPPPPPPSSPVAQVGDNFQEVDGTPAAISDHVLGHDNDGGGGEGSDVESGFGGGGSSSCVKKVSSVGSDEEECRWSFAYWNHGDLGDQYLEEYERWVKAAGFRSGGVLHSADQGIDKDTHTSEEEGRAFWEACLASCYPSP